MEASWPESMKMPPKIHHFAKSKLVEGYSSSRQKEKKLEGQVRKNQSTKESVNGSEKVFEYAIFSCRITLDFIGWKFHVWRDDPKEFSTFEGRRIDIKYGGHPGTLLSVFLNLTTRRNLVWEILFGG